MQSAQFFNQIRERIARDELETALTQLRLLLEHSPQLDEVIPSPCYAFFEASNEEMRFGGHRPPKIFLKNGFKKNICRSNFSPSPWATAGALCRK